MKKEDMAGKILRVLGQVDDDMVEEARPGRRPKQRRWNFRPLAAAAAAVAVIVGAGIALYSIRNSAPRSGETEDGNVSYEIAASDHYTEEEMITDLASLSDGYTYEVSYGDVVYTDCAVSVEEARLGDSLGEATVTVWDVGEDTIQNVTAQTRGITEIQENCAIAVWIEEEESWRAFVNTAYTAATLGEFLDDLNLRQDLSFGTVYDYGSSDGTISYDGVDDELIWKLLFSNTSAEAVDKENISIHRLMSISVDIPVLGYTNISVSVTEDGYLWTNILATGKAFYIGEEAVAAFAEHVRNNYEGAAEG